MAVHFIPTVRWYYISVVKLLSDCLSTLSIDAIRVPKALNHTMDHISGINSKKWVSTLVPQNSTGFESHNGINIMTERLANWKYIITNYLQCELFGI